MAPSPRTNRFNMLFSDDELIMLRALGDAEGVTSSDTVRALIRRAFKDFAKPDSPAGALEKIRHRIASKTFDERTFPGRRTADDMVDNPMTMKNRKVARKSRKRTPFPS